MNNGPYCRPIELLQEYKHGARQNRLEGIEARKKKKQRPKKKAFHLGRKKRKHNLLNRVISLRAGTTARAPSRASAVQEKCRRLSLFVFSLYFRVEKKKLAQWRRRELFLWTAAAVLQSHHKSRDPPWGELASSLLSQPLFSTKHD